jgi:hypothetical protein
MSQSVEKLNVLPKVRQLIKVKIGEKIQFTYVLI